MAKKDNRKSNGTTVLALACVCYGGILGYSIGQSMAQKQAARQAEAIRTARRISDMEAAIHKLTHPDMYEEDGTLKAMQIRGPFSTMGGIE